MAAEMKPHNRDAEALGNASGIFAEVIAKLSRARKTLPSGMRTPDEQLPSPFSTGGGGTIFELKVQAGLLATLLVNGHVPSFDNAIVQELHLQSEHLGYKTDDALLICVNKVGEQRKQLWSVKHEVKYTESDQIFRDVIADAWVDFKEPKRFTPELDAIVLATGPLASTHQHLLTLLEFARATSSANDFYARLGRKGLISKKASEYSGLIHKLCETVARRAVDPEEIWKFLRSLHVLGYDFDQSASQDEARFKSLMATAAQKSSGNTGEDLWNAIFKWVADSNPRAKSFTRATLPVEWQQATIGVRQHFESGAINRLLEHSADLLKRVRVSIGQSFHLKRPAISESLSATFLNERFTLVTGPAGVGKSAASIVALREVLCGAPLFVFQAAEFARASLENAMADLRITEPLSQISALFALHRQKFLLIESVERLLEAPQRDAFFSFLTRVSEDSTWRVILTCRQHAASMVRDAFLTPIDIDVGEIDIPLLESAELDEVIQHLPGLKRVASHPRTRELLKNPYYLDKAASVDWSKESTKEPIDQRRLREIIWRQIVAREDMRAAGINFQRDRCFQEIAVRRARSLQSFVAIASGEEAAAQSLIADELLVVEPTTNHVAPAHDVLEDWALMRWITVTHDSTCNDAPKFFELLGHELPIRRTYRHWLREWIADEKAHNAHNFIDAVLIAPSVTAYWKDETIVSVLLSADAPRFIQDHETVLLANKKQQLKTVIHLLRVACKKLNAIWQLPEHILGKLFGDLYLIPEGTGWGAVIRLVHRNLSKFNKAELPLILGLLEDWKAGINHPAPLPDAAREVGLIALHFWNLVDNDYLSKELLERIASVFVAIPQSISTEFEKLLGSSRQAESAHRDFRNEILQSKLLASLECWPTSRSHAEALARFAAKTWRIDQSWKGRRQFETDYHYSHDIDGHFGLRTGLRFEYYPASALQGPFLALLHSNPHVGVELILKLCNEATNRYVSSSLDRRYGDGPGEIEVDLGDGKVCKQTTSVRLWLAYRDTMPVPNILASALMAFEKWLLESAKSGHDVAELAQSLIAASNNVAVTAVVASVAMAYPQKVGATALAFLRTPEFFELDLQRYVTDQRSINESFSDDGLNSIQKVHHSERVKSDKLGHRKRNLELLACDLQTGPLRDQVWKIIDDLKSALPPKDQQKEWHKIWRLRLHRIDLRNFSQKELMSDGHVQFSPGPPEPDIAEVIENSAPAIRANAEATSLLVWGMSAFERRDPNSSDGQRWRQMLEVARRLAREQDGKDLTEIFHHEGGPAYVAAVCVRDHWNDLSSDERMWCRELLLTKVSAQKDTDNEILRAQVFAMAGVVAAVQVLPLLLADSDDPTRQRVRNAIADAITHSMEQVPQYAAVAVGRDLWERDPNLASACIAGLLELAAAKRCCYSKWKRAPYESRCDFHSLVAKELPRIRARISSGQPADERFRFRFSLSERFSASCLPLIATIVAQQRDSALAQKIHREIAESFVNTWSRDFRHGGHRQPHDYDEYSRRNHQAESTLRKQYAQFVVGCRETVARELWKPFEGAIENCAEEVAEVFEKLIYAEDSIQNGTAFWAIWNATKSRLLSLRRFHEQAENERSGCAKLASVLLLDDVSWKPEARDWKPLRGHETEIRDLVDLAGTAPPICRSLIRLLDGVGACLLPDALRWLSEQLRKGHASQMIGDRNSLFSLARILTPLVFSQTETLRKSPPLRDAALLILDAMVEQGSSSAFRMRDFLITPIAPAK